MTGMIRSDSRGGTWRGRARKWAADRLFAAARRLDPVRPEAKPGTPRTSIRERPVRQGSRIEAGDIETLAQAQAAIDKEYRRNTGGRP